MSRAPPTPARLTVVSGLSRLTPAPPSPRLPLSSLPQQCAVPAAVSPQVTSSLATMSMKPTSAICDVSTAVATRRCDVALLPISPLSPSPQQYALPSSVTPQLWLSETTTLANALTAGHAAG